MGDYLTTGYSFSGTSPNNVVTADKLNSAVNDATLKTSAITARTEITALATDDYLLGYDTSAAALVKVSAGNAITAARGRPSATNLLMLQSGNASVAITADFVLMRSPSTGNLYLASAYSVTADISLGVAVNGLDSSTEAANTVYYIYAISNGTLDRCLLTASAVAPTLPTGYIYQALLGTVQNDNSSNFRYFQQHGNVVSIESPYDGDDTGDARHLNPQTASVDFTSVAPAVAETFQAVDLARCIPPNIVSSVSGIVGVTGTTAVSRFIGIGSAGIGSTFSAISGVSGLVLARLAGFVPTSTSANADPTHFFGFQNAVSFTVPLSTSRQIVWTSSGTGSIHSMRITGYTLAL